MCGIFGIVINEGAALDAISARLMFERLLFASEIRGKEASGVALKAHRCAEIVVFKGAWTPRELARQREYQSIVAGRLHDCYQDKTPGGKASRAYALIGHSRLVTNGSERVHVNNHPVIKDGIVMVHNGIVTNVDQVWAAHPELVREAEVDTEVLAALFRAGLVRTGSAGQAIGAVFDEIEGAASVAVMGNDFEEIVLATNTGSLYCVRSAAHGVTVFASEKYILLTAIERSAGSSGRSFGALEWGAPGTAWLVSLEKATVRRIAGKDVRDSRGVVRSVPPIQTVVDISPQRDGKARAWSAPTVDRARARAEAALLRYDTDRIESLRRCTRCVLPETFPFIRFDMAGVCNYCTGHVPRSCGGREEELRAALDPHRSRDGTADCIVAFSGGRDSSYGLHYLVRELGLRPLTFTYDWGMATDITRRNVARVCGKLGLENIMISADLRMKRANLRRNLLAWLRKPVLGMLPLFMAGDKQFFQHANRVKRENGIAVDIWCTNWMENTEFKVGFCGIPPARDKKHIYSLSPMRKLHISAFYLKEFLVNPAYINSSLIDTARAFTAYYLEPRETHYVLYDYVRWDERTINDTIIREFDWETSPDTRSTWRIGDAPIPFINYCYLLGAGFSEIDTFRSNQVREGMLTREQALDLVMEDNRPRYESIRKFLEMIELDYTGVIRAVNAIDDARRARTGEARIAA